MATDDELWMRRALVLGARAVFTSPNPRVGAIVVRADDVLGEGWHEGPGTPHAEARALDGVDAAGATLYATLEPCIHRGRTAPCVPTIIAAGIARVVVPFEDPDPRVAGGGLRALRGAGIAVTTGILIPEARALNAAYLHHRATGRPWVTLKLALSIDGRLAAPDRSSRWITGDAARRRVHRRRAEVDAVLVGARTVLSDGPRLTARDVAADRQPLRVVLDPSGRVPPDATVLGPEALVVTTPRCPHEVQTAWKETGAEVVSVESGPEGIDLEALLEFLGARGVLEVYCEGGATLATSLLRRDLVRRLEIHHGPVVLGAGGPELGDVGVGTMAGAIRWRLVDVERAEDDTITTYERTGG